MIELDTAVHRKRNIVGAVVTVFVLVLLSLFAWRVYHFASLIQSGELTEEDLAFAQKLTVSQAIAAEPIPDGEFDVATADDPSLGSRDAALTIVEFADFGCPFSREESLVIRAAAAAYGDKVRFIYRDFPILELHPDAFNAAEAGECAAEQGKFWEYHDKLYANQSDLSADALVRYAAELNLSVGDFKRCLASDRNVAEVQADYEAGVAAGVRGTPTFFLNGTRVAGAIPADVLAKLIERYNVSQPL
jgi:protein-disulfide isomerase